MTGASDEFYEREADLEEAEEALLQQQYYVSRWMPHQTFARLKRTCIAETAVLRSLLSLRRAVKRVDVKEAMFGFHVCREELKAWAAELVPAAASFRSLSVGQPEIERPEYRLANWLYAFLDVLIAKSSVYFAIVFMEQAMRAGEKLRRNGRGFELVAKAEDHVREGKSALVAVVLQENQGLHGDGWKLVRSDERKGLGAFPAIFHAPASPSGSSLLQSHWPNVISVMLMKEDRLADGAAVMYPDSKMRVTYVLYPIEMRLTLVCVVPDRKEGSLATLADVKRFASRFVTSLRNASPPIRKPSRSPSVSVK